MNSLSSLARACLECDLYLSMISQADITNWTPTEVSNWLAGLGADKEWLKSDYIMKNNFDGKDLSFMTSQDLELLGATKVELQENILEAIEKLKFHSFNSSKETLQAVILRLACQSRSLHRQLASKREISVGNHEPTIGKSIVLTSDFIDNGLAKKQRVSLDTLANVSAIVTSVRHINDILSCAPFSKYADYRSMRSLLLALSIELTSTAQRDQFVETPNDIIEKSSKALADYCDRIVYGTSDTLLIQPFQLETVKIERSLREAGFGFSIKSTIDNVHIIDKILPLSSATKTNKLNEGDEIIYFNQSIVGWSAENVDRLVNASSQLKEVILVVKKRPSE